jgi:hypothetical protein
VEVDTYVSTGEGDTLRDLVDTLEEAANLHGLDAPVRTEGPIAIGPGAES